MSTWMWEGLEQHLLKSLDSIKKKKAFEQTYLILLLQPLSNRQTFSFSCNFLEKLKKRERYLRNSLLHVDNPYKCGYECLTSSLTKLSSHGNNNQASLIALHILIFLQSGIIEELLGKKFIYAKYFFPKELLSPSQFAFKQ